MLSDKMYIGKEDLENYSGVEKEYLELLNKWAAEVRKMEIDREALVRYVRGDIKFHATMDGFPDLDEVHHVRDVRLGAYDAFSQELRDLINE